MTAIDWHALFVPTAPLLETVLRGSFMYLFLFVVLRLFRRDAGGLGVADVLLVVIVSDAAQNGLSGTYQSLTEGALLVLTIVGWNYLIDWLAYHSPRLRRLLEPQPLLLVRDGQMQRRNMRRELISVPELHSLLREHEVEDIRQVSRATLEPDGRLSVVKA